MFHFFASYFYVLFLFKIPSFADGRVASVDPLVAGALVAVIVDDPARLQMRVDRYCTEVFEAAPFQFPADPVGETVAYRNIAFFMSVISNGFAV